MINVNQTVRVMKISKQQRKILEVVVPVIVALIAIVPPMLNHLAKVEPSPPPPECNPLIFIQNNKQYFTDGEGFSYDNFSNSIELGGYEVDTFTYEIPNDTDSLRNFFKYRADAYNGAIAKICREKLAFTVDEQLVRERNEEANKEHPEVIISAVLDDIFLHVFDLVTYDCQRGRFVCQLAIGHPNQAEDFLPEDVAGYIKNALKRIDLYKQFKINPLEVNLDVGALLETLENDNDFMAGYAALLERFDKELNILKLSVETKRGNYSVFFDSGDYRLNPVTMLIINLVAQQYKECVENYPQRRFRIIANGFADGRPVGANGIPYNREGRWSRDGAALPFADGQGEVIGAVIAPGEKGNRQLAYARGYEGMLQLQRAMEKDYEALQKVELTYSGSVGSAGQNPYERRISFNIQELK